jgi:uncharacterized protein YraI
MWIKKRESGILTTRHQRPGPIRIFLLLVAAMISSLGVGLIAPGTASAGIFTGRVDTGSSLPLNVRQGPSTSTGVVRTLTNGSAVGLNCYVHGQAVSGRWGVTDIWDQIDGGGWASDGFVYTGSNNPVVPLCGSNTKADHAVAWANSMVGATGYDGWCELFVENAYGTSSRYGSALANFNAQQAAGRISTSTNVPAGALAFFRNPYDGGYGHVEISRGDGSYVSTAATVRVVSLSYGGTFLGWAPAPDSWPGR